MIPLESRIEKSYIGNVFVPMGSLYALELSGELRRASTRASSTAMGSSNIVLVANEGAAMDSSDP